MSSSSLCVSLSRHAEWSCWHSSWWSRSDSWTTVICLCLRWTPPVAYAPVFLSVMATIVCSLYELSGKNTASKVNICSWCIISTIQWCIQMHHSRWQHKWCENTAVPFWSLKGVISLGIQHSNYKWFWQMALTYRKWMAVSSPLPLQEIALFGMAVISVFTFKSQVSLLEWGDVDVTYRKVESAVG